MSQTPEQIAADLREQKAQYPDFAGMEQVIAVSYIQAAHRATYLSDAQKLAEIGDVLAALDLVRRDSDRKLAATMAEVKAELRDGA